MLEALREAANRVVGTKQCCVRWKRRNSSGFLWRRMRMNSFTAG